MMDLTIDLAEAQSDNDCDEPAPTKGNLKEHAAIHPKRKRPTRVMTFSSLPHLLVSVNGALG